jgi:hypothetical protein
VSEAQEKIEKLKRMISETEMMEAQAELQEMAKGMVTQIGGGGDTLNRVEEYLNERRDKAAGRARVAYGSIDIKEYEIKQSEQEALAAQALSEFEVAYGLKSEPEQNSDNTAGQGSGVKELGPQ